MTSLFSSFDLMFFYFSNFILALVLITFFSFTFLQNSLFFFVQKVFLNLEEFFYSLKSKSFNKMSAILAMMLVFSIFFLNFFSVFPYNFATSSQFSLIFFTSLVIWVSMISFNFFCNFKGVISHFIPEGTPIYLTMLLFLIELISNFIRPLTLTVRLVANILAGHLLLILLSKLVLINMLILPLYLMLNLVEFFVAMIQSYIFTTMIMLYFSEVH